MTESSPDHTLQLLVGQADFLRKLARSLLGDEHLSEDVVQDAWIATLAKPEARAASASAWLRGVVRNLSRMKIRSERRRRERERTAAVDEAQPDVADRAIQESVAHDVLSAVFDLPPNLREVVLLRYFEDLPPRKIAVRLNLSGAAVKSRLRRATGLLRERLDGRFDGRRQAWCVPLAAFSGIAPSTLTVGGTVVGAIVMELKSKLAIVVAVLLVLVGAAAWWIDESPEGPPTLLDDVTPPALADVPPSRVASEEAGSPRQAERNVVEGDVPTRPYGIAWDGQVWITGLVVDPRRVPVAGAEVILHRPDQPTVTTQSKDDGRFRLQTGAPRGNDWRFGLVARDSSGRACVSRAIDPTGRAFDHEIDAGDLVLREAHPLTLHVRSGGAPVSGALVTLRAGLGESLVGRSSSGESGTVAWEHLPPGVYHAEAVDGSDRRAVARVDHIGRDTGPTILNLEAGASLTVTVTAADTARPIVGGRVDVSRTMPRGSSIPLVKPGVAATTDATGTVLLGGLGESDDLIISASAPGYAAATVVATMADRGTALGIALTPVGAGSWAIAAGAVAPPHEGIDLLVARLDDLRIVDGMVGVVENARLVVRGLHPGHSDYLAVAPSGAVARFQTWIDDGTSESPLAREGAGWDAVSFIRPRSVEVFVRDPRGRPVVGLPITVTDPTRLPIRPTRRTDDEGRTRFSGFLGGQFAVHSHATSLVRAPKSELLGIADLASGDARLEVVREQGRRVRAQVSVNGRRGLPAEFWLRTDEVPMSGMVEDAEAGVLEFTLWPLTSHQSVIVALAAPGYRTASAAVHFSSPAGTVPVAIDLESRLAFELRVRPPATGEYALLLERTDGTDRWSHVWTRAFSTPAPNHTYLCGDLDPGRYRVRDRISGVCSDDVRLADNAITPSLVLDLSTPTFIAGRIEGPPDVALTGTELLAHWHRNGVVDEEGAEVELGADYSFTLPTAPRRTVTLRVRHPLLALDPTTAEPVVVGAATGIVIRLVPAPCCELVFGHPPPGLPDVPWFVNVDLLTPDGSGDQLFRPSPAGDRRVIFSGYEIGTYDVFVDAAPFAPVLLRDVSLDSGRREIDVPLSTGGSIRISLLLPTDAAAAPTVSAKARSLGSPSFSRMASLDPDQDEIILTGLIAGRYQVEIVHERDGTRRSLQHTIKSDGAGTELLTIDLR